MRTKNPDSPTKHKILAAAQDIMLTKGYHDTSVDEICKKSGVAKGSFFHHFKDKDAVATEAMDCFIRDRGSDMASCCAGEGDPLKRIMTRLDNAIKATKSPEFKGCLMGTLLQETARTRPKIRQACCEGLEKTFEYLEQDLRAAKDKYAPKSDLNPREMAQFYFAVMQGSFLLAKAQGNPKLIEANVRMLKKTIREALGK